MASTRQSDATTSAESAAWLDGLRGLIAAVRDTPVHEVELRFGDTAVFLRRRPGVVRRAPPEAAPAPAEPQASRAAVRAPLNGIYYDRSSPEAEPFVQVGDRVETGQVVALIEAMKVFNEVHAEQPGQVAALLVESGDMVQSGQDLIALEAESADTDEP